MPTARPPRVRAPCVLCARFDFTDTRLLALTKHLGGGSAILRVGGSDQNNYHYDMQSEHPPAKCCRYPGSCHGCSKDCIMTAPYWKSLVEFAVQSGHRLMFGLVPEAVNATALIEYSAKNNLAVHAYTYGNEKDTDAVIAGYPVSCLL